MSKSKQQPAKKPAELSDEALSKASGGALNAYMPTDQNTAGFTGGVRTDNTFLGGVKNGK